MQLRAGGGGAGDRGRAPGGVTDAVAARRRMSRVCWGRGICRGVRCAATVCDRRCDVDGWCRVAGARCLAPTSVRVGRDAAGLERAVRVGSAEACARFRGWVPSDACRGEAFAVGSEAARRGATGGAMLTVGVGSGGKCLAPTSVQVGRDAAGLERAVRVGSAAACARFRGWVPSDACRGEAFAVGSEAARRGATGGAMWTVGVGSGGKCLAPTSRRVRRGRTNRPRPGSNRRRSQTGRDSRGPASSAAG